MKKSRIKTIIIAVSVIAFFAYLVLVIGINLKYPKAQLEEKQIGEAMTADDFEITATDVSFMSQEDFSDIYAFEKEMFKEAECIMVTVNIKNMSEEKQRVTLEGFTLTSQAWRRQGRGRRLRMPSRIYISMFSYLFLFYKFNNSFLSG